MNLISLIIPIYNVGEYLQQCLESVSAQSIIDECEIILVNDGSTDNSLQICEQFAASNNNVVVVTQENAGLSEARNTGKRLAKGNYVYFLDSDDWLGDKALEILLDFAVKNHCDIVQANHFYAYEDRCLCVSPVDGSVVYSRDEAMDQLVQNKYIHNFAWGKLYRRDIVDGIDFRPNVYFEDSFWMHYVIDKGSKIGVVNKPLYYYRQRSSSISGSFTIKNFDLIKGNLERLAFISNNYPNLKKKLCKSIENILWDFLPYCRHDKILKQTFKTYLEQYVKAAGVFSCKMRILKSQGMIYRVNALLLRIYYRLFAKNTVVIFDRSKNNT